MSINVNDKNLGHATAYAYYKAGGGTMTEAEFTEFMADFGTASQTAVEAAQAALASKNAAQTAATTAANKATEATTAATTATNKAAEAQADADAAALDASQALSAASTATTKATEATTAAATATSAATTATTAKDDAVSAKTAAQTAQTGAETAAASVQSSAAQIATNAEDISQLKSDLDNDKITTNVPANWAQNRVMLSGGVLTEVTSTVFANSGIIETTEDLTIEVAQGYTIFGWATAYNELGHGGQEIVNAWSSGKITYTYDSAHPYLVLCLQKSPSAVITATEAADAVKIYSENETIFALKTTVAEISGAVDELDVNVDNLKNGVEVSTVNLPLIFRSGRVTVSNSSITVATNSSFAYMKYAELKYATEYTMHVPSGLDVFGYVVNQNNDTYTRMEPFTSAWVSGENTIKHTVSSEMQYYYLILSVKKTAGGAITAEEASTITITYESTDDVQIVEELKLNINKAAFCHIATKGQILYNADTSASADHIVNALSYDDGTIIACRSNGKVVRIGYDGTETDLLSLSGNGFDWRLCWLDSNENVYVSPHASWGSMTMTDRGLYRLAKGQNSFTKVISLYDPNSSVTTEKEENDDTIWTMCEDDAGNLYAGVYAHTVRANPAIYKSTDGGNTWTYLINFNSARYTLGGRHIHAVVFSKWKNALYCIVGEINTVFKSTNGGTNWENLNVTLRTKGSALLATRNGLLIGSDGAYNCEIDLLYNDDTTHETVFSGWANTVFGIRQSDLTGFIYAYTKIDSSVANDQYMPSYGVLYGTRTLEAWKNGDYTGGTPPTHLAEWEEYNASVSEKYPNDAIRPQHFAILISRDGGLNWEVLKAIPCDSRAAYGIWTIGQFKNGECLCGVYTGNYANGSFVTGVTNPMVISEGKHKYVSTGCDLDGEILVRTNASSIVALI